MTAKSDAELNHFGKLESRVTELEKGQQTLIAVTTRIETMASQLMDNQKGVFGRLNRPWQWSVVVAIFAGLFTLVGGMSTALVLVVDPIKSTIADIQQNDKEADDRNRAYHDKIIDESHDNAVQIAVNKESIRWMEKLEERYFLATTGKPATTRGDTPCCRGPK